MVPTSLAETPGSGRVPLATSAENGLNLEREIQVVTAKWWIQMDHFHHFSQVKSFSSLDSRVSSVLANL